MMVFGQVDRFAIEFEMDDNPGGDWLFGRVSYWLCGQRVGDYAFSTSLRDVLFCWTRIACDANNRSSEELILLDKEVLANLLWYGLYGNPVMDETIENRAIEEQWARFVIGPDVDVFEGWHIFLLEDRDMARCIYLIWPQLGIMSAYWNTVNLIRS